jgi:DMSO/TMAO reductase YedYZ molybdopterin-dependent catalytic subunit
MQDSYARHETAIELEPMISAVARPVLPSRLLAAIAGAVAGAAALGTAELAAGILPGAASLVVAVADLIVALQPPGAKQFVVDLFGEADKLVVNLLIVAVAIAGAAGLGLLARSRPTLARAGFAVAGLGAFGASLRDPLAEGLMTFVATVLAVGVGTLVLDRFMRLASPAAVEMPDWSRRWFIGGSIALVGAAAAGGWVGRTLLERGRIGAQPQEGQIPPPAETATPLPAGVDLGLAGVSPIVTPNHDFYRIDTAFIVPRPQLATWRLRVTGMVRRPFELTYDELLREPLHEQYVTIACVSNEVGGGLVGNAKWTGARLKAVLERADIDPNATQIVGRAVDGFTVGFPLAWALADRRESLVAVQMNDEPLPAEHGFPARLIVPGLFGYVSATKWLTEIELTTMAFDAYWVPLGWAKEAPILTQSRIDVPRGNASLTAGMQPIAGVAWAPDRGISSVEVQVDEADWQQATLSTPISDATWVQWLYSWTATDGEHTIRVRATDGDGEIQTDQRSEPAPDGARGHHTIRVRVG